MRKCLGWRGVPSRGGLDPRGLAAGLLVAMMLTCVPAPRRDPHTVLFASGADLQSINPLVAVHPLAKQVQKHVLFRTIAKYDAELAPRPDLATWSWSEDRTVLVLHLAEDVWWHDGPRTTARDVVWTLQSARDPRTSYPRSGDLAAVRSVSMIDSFTVELRFGRSQPIFPDVLTDLAILPAHHFAGVPPDGIRRNAFNLSPVGNGPFEFVEYRPNQRWVFRRRDTSASAHAVERFVIVVVDESTTKLAALTSGELDFAGINPAHASFVRRDPALDVVDYPVQFAVALIWNLRRDLFRDVAIRRALTHAINRQQLVDAYLYGFGSVADGPVSPDHRWYAPADPIPFDPPQAESILDSLGWRRGRDGWRQRDGVSLEFELLAVSSGENALEQMVQAQLADVGVKMRIRRLELSSFLATAQGPERGYDALSIGISGDLSLGHVAAMYGGQGGPLAYPGYDSPPFDAALRDTREATTADGVAFAWREAQRILSRDLPTTWLYHARGVQGVNRRIQEIDMDLRGELVNVERWLAYDRSVR